MHFVYLLQSKVDNTFYIGFTSDVKTRLVEHNAGTVYYTKRKMPWDLVYYEAFLQQEQAIIREKQLKKFGSSYYGLMKRLGYK